MIEKIWSGQNRLYWLLIPFALLYGLIVFIRVKFYQLGIFKSWKSPVPIIVVGNLSAGGNGKTPLVIYLVEQFKAKGYKVGVVSRGYGGKSDTYPVIVTADSTADIVGDEPVLIFQRTQVPLAVSPIRKLAVEALLAEYELDLIITDDGLQHYALKRDVEIVVIDGKRGFGNGWFIPAGPMRESTNRLNSVDFIVINGEAQNNFTNLSSYKMTLQPSYAINLKTNETKPVQQLENICAMAGIGDPNRFFSTLKSIPVHLVNAYSFADHQNYSKQQLADLVHSQQTLLMTEKDAVKCRRFANDNWWYLPVDAQLPEEFIVNLYNQIKDL